jgi:D-3-phosphoglycerate dehydrogenase / 2-oxoglutarate reductase
VNEQRLRVLVREPIAEAGIELLRRDFDVDVDSESDLAGVIDRYDGIVIRSTTQLTAELIDRAGRLKVIGRAGVGVDNVDVEAATRRGIVVANAPDSTVVSAAEQTIGLLVALARNIPQAHAALKQGRWERSRWSGIELAGKTLGVLGLGAIGRRVAELAQAFGMTVLAWSRRAVETPGVELVGLEELLGRSDVVSVSVALNEETRGLLGADRLALMKPGAILVNTARGGIVDDEALRRLLEAGHLGGAVLDVLGAEPPDAAELVRLASAPNVLVTPHIAFHTDEALARQFGGMTDNVLAFLAGEPRNLVTSRPTLAA